MNDNVQKEKNFISAVVYVHNSEEEIDEFLSMLYGYLDKTFDKFEIICVDDASNDKSADMVRDFAKRSEGAGTISLVSMSYYQGLELSMDAGVDLSIGDFVYEFDSTLVTYPADMPLIVYEKCLEGFDIVNCSPRDSGHKVSGLFYRIYNAQSNSQYKLQTEAFRILSRRSINRVQSMSRTLPYRKAVYANCGLPTLTLFYDSIKKIPVARNEEKRNQRETAIDALMLYTDIAYKFAFGFSALMMVITLAVAIYTLITYFTIHPVAGWTTTILFLAFCFFIASLLLTILIKYASLILKTIFTRQKYVIKSIDNYGN